jgi:hypothetical protein
VLEPLATLVTVGRVMGPTRHREGAAGEKEPSAWPSPLIARSDRKGATPVEKVNSFYRLKRADSGRSRPRHRSGGSTESRHCRLA